MKIRITELALNYLKFHAKENKGQEIYGWMLGYEEEIDDGTHITILCSYSAHDYVKQSLIGAEPNPSEIASIENILPIGMYNLGQYHSHPSSVFHSDTDDKTLLQMAKIYNNVLSMVTNGEDTKLFMVDNETVVEKKFEVIKITQKIEFIDFKIKLRLSKENKPSQAMEMEKILSKLNFGKNRIKIPEVVLGNDIRGKVKFKIPLIKNQQMDSAHLMIKKYAINIMYELISTFKKEINSPKLVNYQDIPINILEHSFSEITSIKRAAMLKSFGREKESKQWKEVGGRKKYYNRKYSLI